jgi:hypothetical protein
MSRHNNTGWKADCDARKAKLIQYTTAYPDTPVGVLARRFGVCKKTASKAKRAITGEPSTPPPRKRPLVIPPSLLEAKAKLDTPPKRPTRKVWCYEAPGCEPEPVACVKKFADGGRFCIVAVEVVE